MEGCIGDFHVPTHGSLTPLAGVFMFPVVVSENAGHPVFDCSVANYFIISSVTQADAITLANCAPVNVHGRHDFVEMVRAADLIRKHGKQ